MQGSRWLVGLVLGALLIGSSLVEAQTQQDDRLCRVFGFSCPDSVSDTECSAALIERLRSQDTMFDLRYQEYVDLLSGPSIGLGLSWRVFDPGAPVSEGLLAGTASMKVIRIVGDSLGIPQTGYRSEELRLPPTGSDCDGAFGRIRIVTSDESEPFNGNTADPDLAMIAALDADYSRDWRYKWQFTTVVSTTTSLPGVAAYGSYVEIRLSKRPHGAEGWALVRRFDTNARSRFQARLSELVVQVAAGLPGGDGGR